MNKFEIKTVIPVENNALIKDCEQKLLSDNFCLGIFNKEKEFFGFVLKKDLDKAIKLDLRHFSINTITTYANFLELQPDEITENILNKNLQNILNRGLFIGENIKTVNKLVLLNQNNNETSALSIREIFEKQLPAKIKKAIDMIYITADKHNIPVYLVGGIARDLIISNKSIDTDICVEYNAIDFSKLLKKDFFNQVKIKSIHEDFKTAKIVFDIYGDDIEIDIASTRTESYSYPAALPLVEKIGCNIFEDLIRRDFTINAMAISLNKKNFCKIVDPLNALEDIQNKTIKIIHPLSFLEDPTRILRGLKFRIRFNCELEETTKKLQQECLNSGLFNGLSGERIKSELKQTLNINKAICLEKMFEEKIYKLISKDIVPYENLKEISKKCEKTILKYKNNLNSPDFIWLIYLSVILSNLDVDKVTLITKDLYLSGIETEIIMGTKTIIEKAELLKEAEKRYDIYEQLEGFFIESVIASMIIIEDTDVLNNIELFINELQNIKINLTGKSLINLGLSPGPMFGEILSCLLKAKINREIKSEKDELNYVKRLIEK